MNSADIELARMIYLASALGALLFTSLFLRGLWRPLRFLLLAFAVSVFFTPYFVDGNPDHIVPAFISMAHDLVQHHKDPQPLQYAKPAGSPILLVFGVTGFFALLLAFLLPKPARSAAAAEKPAPEKNKDKMKKTKRNPYLPEDFQPQ
jgi:hypothetical protein